MLYYGTNYDAGNNHPGSGYDAPVNGYYLIISQLHGQDSTADHYIRVNGADIAFTKGEDADIAWQTAASSLVLKLNAGDRVEVYIPTTWTIHGHATEMRTWMSVALICTF